MPTLDEMLKIVKKKHGDGSLIQYGKEEKIVDIPRITTGLPSLDLILGGGVPEGRIMEVFGPESSGKTTMAIHMLSKCQEEGKKVVFMDLEYAFDPVYGKQLGLDLKELIISRPDSGEAALDIVEKLCQTNDIAAIVIDSVAQLMPMATIAKEIDGTQNIATTARLLSQTMPRLSHAASKSGTALIFINQIRMNVGQLWGNPEVTPGGRALKYMSSIRLDVRGASKAEERNGKEGIPVKVTVKKNKTAPPFRQTELFLVFGEGFDEVADLLETALQVGIIEKAGGWYSYKAIKEQGFDNFCDKLRKDKDLMKIIRTTLSEIKT